MTDTAPDPFVYPVAGPPLGIDVDAALEEFPEFAAVLAQIDQHPPLTYDGNGACDRCGASVPAYGLGGGQPNPRVQHGDWHRQLTIAIHLNAWIGRTVLLSLAELAAEETVSLDEAKLVDGLGRLDAEEAKAEPERHTPKEWNALTGYRIVDWDGFTDVEPADLITRADFEHRFWKCTVRDVNTPL